MPSSAEVPSLTCERFMPCHCSGSGSFFCNQLTPAQELAVVVVSMLASSRLLKVSVQKDKKVNENENEAVVAQSLKTTVLECFCKFIAYLEIISEHHLAKPNLQRKTAQSSKSIYLMVIKSLVAGV